MNEKEIVSCSESTIALSTMLDEYMPAYRGIIRLDKHPATGKVCSHMIAVRQFFADGAFWEYCDSDGVWMTIFAHNNNHDAQLACLFNGICSCEFYVGEKRALDPKDAKNKGNSEAVMVDDLEYT